MVLRTFISIRIAKDIGNLIDWICIKPENLCNHFRNTNYIICIDAIETHCCIHSTSRHYFNGKGIASIGIILSIGILEVVTPTTTIFLDINKL